MSRLEAGSVVGERYEILSLLKAGGMGAVYQARDVRGGPVVALKEMLQSFSFDVDRQLIYKKFEEEAQMLETLNHPSIPRVLHHFAKGDVYYIVMEYIEGESLEQLLEDYLTLTRKPMPPQLVVECALLLCPILTYLHTRKPRHIIHRDLKPGNIILRQARTEVVLVDFGLARHMSDTLTASPKTMVGTLGYAPLEQLRGQPDVRSDLYALGVTMHHLLTGRVPRLFELAPLESIAPNLPGELMALVNTLTREDPNLRLQSAAELEVALSQLLATWKPMPRLSMARSLASPGRATGHPKPNRSTSRMVQDVPPVDPGLSPVRPGGRAETRDPGRVPPDGRFSTQDDSEPEASVIPPGLPLPPLPPAPAAPAPPRAAVAARPPAPERWRALLPVGTAIVFAGGLWAGLFWGRQDPLAQQAVASPTPPAVMVTVTPVALPTVPSPVASATPPAPSALTPSSSPESLGTPDERVPYRLLASDLQMLPDLKCDTRTQVGVVNNDGQTFLRADGPLGQVVFTREAASETVNRLSFVLKADSGDAPFLVWDGNCGVLVDKAAGSGVPQALVLQWPDNDVPMQESWDDLRRRALPPSSSALVPLPDNGDILFTLQPTETGLTLDVTGSSPDMVSVSGSPTLAQLSVPATARWMSGPVGCRILSNSANPSHVADIDMDPH